MEDIHKILCSAKIEHVVVRFGPPVNIAASELSIFLILSGKIKIFILSRIYFFGFLCSALSFRCISSLYYCPTGMTHFTEKCRVCPLAFTYGSFAAKPTMQGRVEGIRRGGRGGAGTAPADKH